MAQCFKLDEHVNACEHDADMLMFSTFNFLPCPNISLAR